MLFLLTACFSHAQVPDGYNEFKYQNGKTSSEGIMRNGKPDGYWKTYYENGFLKSEGNRKKFELDSLWKFYDSDGLISVSINYSAGLKDGNRTYYNKDSIIIKQETFLNDTLLSVYNYYNNGSLKSFFPYEKGVLNGSGFEYDTTGLKIVWNNYDIGKLKKRIINRYDNSGKKTGFWCEFYNGILIKETSYTNGLKNGVERIFNNKGDLVKIQKYSNGKLLVDVKEMQTVQVKKELSAQGFIAKSGGFNDNGKPHGIHRNYDSTGAVTASTVFDNGIKIGEGIVLKTGRKNSHWKTYYSNGALKAKGSYKNGVKIGLWQYYYPNGNIESSGEYLYGKEEGLWTEYYESGKERVLTNYAEGYRDGEYKEFDDSGALVVNGNYKDDYEEGEWIYKIGDVTQKGNYLSGNRNGEWFYYYNEKQIIFRGSYQAGMPIDKHLFWFENGNLRKFGNFKSGRKTGGWYEYSKGGKLLMVTTYQDGLVKSYNGYNINPPHDADDYIEYNQTGYR